MLCVSTIISKPRRVDNRALALEWWRGLTANEVITLANKHFPHLPTQLVDMSSSMIERIYNNEKT